MGSGEMIGPETDHGQRRGQGATPAVFYLGLCRLRGILSPPASATVILQAGRSSLPQRKLESDADIVATMPAILCSDSRFWP